MKLSFCTGRWPYTWQNFFETAVETGMKGIELHINTVKRDKSDLFDRYGAAATASRLFEKELSIPCIDSDVDLYTEKTETSVEILKDCLELAGNLFVPFIRVKASEGEGVAERVTEVLKKILPFAEEKGIAVLIETVGAFADTAALRDVLDVFASDCLGALWDFQEPYRLANEEPETTVKNLGAYIRHVHIKDSVAENGEIKWCLMGEGDMPFADMMGALSSLNYDGFISLEWDPKYMPEVPDMDVIFTHFVTYMRRFDTNNRAKKVLYYNTEGTGTFLWKKDELIDLTFGQVLDRMVESYPDQYAFRYTTLDYTRTYSQFRDDVDECCRSLISLGVKPGSHVAVWASNVPQWFILFWAVTKIGAVFVSMNTAYKIYEAEYLLRQSDSHTLIITQGSKDSDYVATVRELCPELADTVPGKPLHSKRLPFLRNVITVGCHLDGCLTWEDAMARADSVPLREVKRLASQVNINDVCNMQYTSGTTGFPKGVMLTHYNVVNNGKYIGDRMDLSTADKMMIQVPMFHCFGMVLSMTASMTHGTTLCPLPYFSPKPALACISREKITCFNGVPTMFIALMQHEDFKKTDVSHIRVGIMAGSNCPADLMKKAADVFNMKQIVSVYGQTEASPGCTMSSFTDSLEVRTETVGSAFANVECKIIDPETGEDCPDGVNGEFVARGYNVMKGYYKMPKATASTVDKDGWLHTGDLACRDENGNYRITGRLKDMIIRGGENIYPKELEEFIFTLPKVRDVQVIGVPDKSYGEEIMACIIPKEGETITEEEIRTAFATHMARHKMPRYIEFMKEFPMNAAGKILKYKMREDAVEKYCK